MRSAWGSRWLPAEDCMIHSAIEHSFPEWIVPSNQDCHRRSSIHSAGYQRAGGSTPADAAARCGRHHAHLLAQPGQPLPCSSRPAPGSFQLDATSVHVMCMIGMKSVSTCCCSSAAGAGNPSIRGTNRTAGTTASWWVGGGCRPARHACSCPACHRGCQRQIRRQRYSRSCAGTAHQHAAGVRCSKGRDRLQCQPGHVSHLAGDACLLSCAGQPQPYNERRCLVVARMDHFSAARSGVRGSQAGQGLWLQGRAPAGAVVGLYPGVLYHIQHLRCVPSRLSPSFL